MNMHLPTIQLALEPRAPLSIHEGRDTRLSVLEGVVWITEEGRFEDFFVHAGEHIELQGGGRAVLLAEESARVEVEPVVPVSIHAGSGWFNRIRAMVKPARRDTSASGLALTVY
jgi:hypothetical protein